MAEMSGSQNTSIFNQTGRPFDYYYFPFSSGVLLILFGIFVSLTAFIGNIIVFFLFFATPSLRTRSQVIILNLCLADFLISVIAIPLEVFWIWMRSINRVCLPDGLLYSRRCVITFGTAASFFVLLLVSIERFIVIFWPLKHKDIVSTPKCTAVLLLAWIGCVIYGIFAGNKSYQKGSSTFAVAATICGFVLIVVCYSCIFFRIKRQSRVRVSLNVQKNRLRSFETRISKTIALILFVYGLCYLPYTVARVTMHKDRPERDWFLILALSHSAFDPVIYFYRSNEYKKAFVDVLRKHFPNRNRIHTEPIDLSIPKSQTDPGNVDEPSHTGDSEHA